jgi:hypothetical protein
LGKKTVKKALVPAVQKSPMVIALEQADAYFDQKKYEESLSYYEIAADLGSAPAQNAVGIFRFAHERYDEAVRLFYSAMKQGDPDAMHNLAVCYEGGFGVPHYLPYAMCLYTQAMLRGNARACESLNNFLIEQADILAQRLLESHASAFQEVLGNHLTLALVHDPIMAPIQLLKHPSNRAIVVGILRRAQKKIAAGNATPHAIAAINELFTLEFVIYSRERQNNATEHLEIVYGEVFDLLKSFQQYQKYLEGKGSDFRAKEKVFENIFNKSKLIFLTTDQQEQVRAEFLKEINDPRWALSAACKKIATEFAHKISGKVAQMNILQPNAPADLDKQWTHALAPKLPIKTNEHSIESLRHPDNREMVKRIMYNTIRELMKSITTMQQALLLIAFLEFKEKVFGLDVAPLFFLKLCEDLNLACSNDLVWLLERLENVDCEQVNKPNGFYTIMNKVLLDKDISIVKNILNDLRATLKNMLSVIHASIPRAQFRQQTEYTLSSYHMALVAFEYQRTQEIHPIVKVLLTKEDLHNTQNWPNIFKELPLPPENTDRFTFTSEAIWFVTTYASTALIQLPEHHDNLKKNHIFFIQLIEMYDAYLIQLGHGAQVKIPLAPVFESKSIPLTAAVSQQGGPGLRLELK